MHRAKKQSHFFQILFWWDRKNIPKDVRKNDQKTCCETPYCLHPALPTHFIVGCYHTLGLIPEWISEPLQLVLGSALHPDLHYMASYGGVHSVGLAARGTHQLLVSARFLLVGFSPGYLLFSRPRSHCWHSTVTCLIWWLSSGSGVTPCITIFAYLTPFCPSRHAAGSL
jgi:hypothetical protein